MFAISDKVVAVGSGNTDNLYDSNDPNWLVLGEEPVLHRVYVIKGFYTQSLSALGLILVGSSIVHLPTSTETGWHYSIFRKLSEVRAENELARTLVNGNGGGTTSP